MPSELRAGCRHASLARTHWEVRNEPTSLHAGGTQTRLVGTDPLGNKYYEDPTRMYGRHRWVVYSDTNDYAASQVHPQWHAWLHCISDDDPVSKPPRKHKFDITFVPNATGTPGRYLPKGSWENPAQRNWGKVEFWQPDGVQYRQ
jgi:NADH:ubiquinone oxidoreductase subunit